MLCPAFWWFVGPKPIDRSDLLEMDDIGGGFLGGMLKMCNT